MRTFDEDTPLSEAGLARRDAMLGQLVQSMQRIHRRRRRRRAAAAAVVTLGLVVVGLWAGPGRKMGRTSRPANGLQAPAFQVRVIGDEELLALLEEIGRPAGLVRSEGRAWLTNDVTGVTGKVREYAPEGSIAPPTL